VQPAAGPRSFPYSPNIPIIHSGLKIPLNPRSAGSPVRGSDWLGVQIPYCACWGFSLPLQLFGEDPRFILLVPDQLEFQGLTLR
jgi:hypothetical protein